MPKTKVAAKANAAASSTAKISGKSKASKAIKKTGPAKGGAKPAAEGDAKKRRFKAGTLALREIKKYQKSIDSILPRAAFMRVVKSIATDMDHALRF